MRSKVDELLRQEDEALERAVAQLAQESKEPSEIIMSLGHLLNRRSNYVAGVREFLEIGSKTGIDVVDQLDGKLAVAIDRFLTMSLPAGFTGTGSSTPGKADNWFKSLPPLPEFPVAYMILFGVRQRLDLLKSRVGEVPPAEAEQGEKALLAQVSEMLAYYVRTRTEAVLRHLSEVQREYAVVARMICRCGKSQHNVELQSLHVDDSGMHYDKLTVRCVVCRNAMELSFPLPFFGDLSAHK